MTGKGMYKTAFSDEGFDKLTKGRPSVPAASSGFGKLADAVRRGMRKSAAPVAPGLGELSDFHPAEVVTDPKLAFRRAGDVPAQAAQLASFGSTYYPVETYGYADRPGDFVVAFGGANSGVGGSNEKYISKALNSRYGKGRYALFTPQQIPQALKFIKSLPKGSRVHYTGWSQGGGALLEMLDTMRKNQAGLPETHSVHLYDAVSPDPRGYPKVDLSWLDGKVTHFMPTRASRKGTADLWAALGGRMENLQGARKVRLPFNHHDIWSQGMQIPKANRTSPSYKDAVRYVFPLKDMSLEELGRYDMAATTPREGERYNAGMGRVLRKVYDPVSETYGFGRNLYSGGGPMSPGLDRPPAMDVSAPPEWTGVSPSYPGNRPWADFYNDSGVGSVLDQAAAGKLPGISDRTLQFLGLLAPITAADNPSKLRLAFSPSRRASVEDAVSGAIEGNIKDWLNRQSGRDALYGFSGLLSDVQQGLNKLYRTGQLSALRGDMKTARAYAKTAYLGQMALEDTMARLRGEYAARMQRVRDPDSAAAGPGFQPRPLGVVLAQLAAQINRDK